MTRRTGIKLIVFFVGAFFAIVGMALATFLRAKRPPLEEGATADYVLVDKQRRRLTLYFQHRRLRSYRVALGRGGPGPKLRSGDAKTPEGLYKIAGHNPKSRYHLALKLDYPSPKDVAMARRRGVRPGSDIEIHGLPRFLGFIGVWHSLIDWTAGCIALTNDEMEELYRVVPDGTLVEIRG